jgi:RNA methyltransferase, TrmH family
MEPVRSSRNSRVAAAVRLHRARDRKREARTILEGPHLIAEALAAGVELHQVFGVGDAPEWLAEAPWISVTAEVLARVADTESPRGPVAVMSIPPPQAPQRDHLVLDVTDPGNAGTLIRTAAAFGLDVVVRRGAVDPWSPKVLRSAAGSHFRTRIGVDQVEAGVIATVVDGGVPVRDIGRHLTVDRLWSVVVGAEAHGVSTPEAAAADIRVSIPMPGGTESLNAAVAGSIVAYELAEWRNSEGGGRSNR